MGASQRQTAFTSASAAIVQHLPHMVQEKDLCDTAARAPAISYRLMVTPADIAVSSTMSLLPATLQRVCTLSTFERHMGSADTFLVNKACILPQNEQFKWRINYMEGAYLNMCSYSQPDALCVRCLVCAHTSRCVCASECETNLLSEKPMHTAHLNLSQL
jgi:hypothetical protein